MPLPRTPDVLVTGIAVEAMEALVDDAELGARGRYWEVAEDGFEAWLGDIRRIA